MELLRVAGKVQSNFRIRIPSNSPPEDNQLSPTENHDKPILVNNKKGIKSSKNKSKRRPDANKKIMSFDFTTPNTDNKSSSRSSSNLGHIIAESFNMNTNIQEVPTKVEEKPQINRGFTMVNKYQE